jgi:DNA-binding LytR/AlgR family response regulator
MKIRALIIDDEKPARSRMQRLLRRYEDIEVVGEARDGREAADLIKAVHPDVLFLDIRMPRLSGFDLLKGLEESPYVIFTTAYDEYALKAFEENTLDYLLKPVDREKLDRAVSKLKKIFRQGRPLPVSVDMLVQSLEMKERIIKRFSVRLGDRILIVPDSRITCFEAKDKYTFLHTEDRDYIIPFSLKELETRLDPDIFLRVHKSCIVNIENISSIHKWFGGRMLVKVKGGKEVIVSQTFLGEFKKRIHL